MRRKFVFCAMAALMLLSAVSYSQEYNDKFGLGLNAGGQRVYGDLTDVGIGIGFEGFATYRMLRFAELALGLGYSQLKYDIPIIGTNTTDLFNIDLRTNLELISKGVVRPYVSLGVGALNFHVGNSGAGRFWEAAVLGGGGFKFRFSPTVAAMIGADYRHTTTDGLDATGGGNNDGYLSVRGGFSYYFPTADSEQSQIMADARAPIFEIGGEDPFAEPLPSSQRNQETKDMEEYARLKSRVDELNRSMESREEEIARVQSSLFERKRNLTTLERKAAAQPPIPLAKASSMSGFSQVYEEALANYYNENYNESISLFRLLLQQNPNHSLAGSCLYWIGQNQLASNRLNDAIDSFSKVLGYDRSSKKDEALFQLGKIHQKKGDSASARQFFSRLISECPTSELVAEARNQIQKL